MKLDFAAVRKCLKAFDFPTLFREHLGRDKHQSQLDVAVDGDVLRLTAVAQKPSTRRPASSSALVQQYTSVRLEGAEQTGADDRERNERIVAELNREEPHTLQEDYTYKRPHGMIFEGQATTGITTWQRLFELVCRHLMARDASRFRALCDHPDFVSNRGNHAVSTDRAALRKALPVGDGLFVESNLSANGIRDALCALLAAFEIPAERLSIFLRQDRNAERPR